MSVVVRRIAVALALVLMSGVIALPFPAAAEGVGGPPPAVRIRPLMLPVMTADNRVERYNQIEVTLEVADSLHLPEVQTATPKLQDAILNQLYQAIGEGYIIRGAIANAPALRKMLLDAANKVMGPGNRISRVLITPTTRQSAWP